MVGIGAFNMNVTALQNVAVLWFHLLPLACIYSLLTHSAWERTFICKMLAFLAFIFTFYGQTAFYREAAAQMILRLDFCNV
jgi:hypothetical protein